MNDAKQKELSALFGETVNCSAQNKKQFILRIRIGIQKGEPVYFFLYKGWHNGKPIMLKDYGTKNHQLSRLSLQESTKFFAHFEYKDVLNNKAKQRVFKDDEPLYFPNDKED